MKIFLKNSNLVFSSFKFEERMYPKSMFTNGKFLDSNGEVSDVEGFAVLDYINIVGATKINALLTFGNTYGGGIVFYDSEYNMISAVYNLDGKQSEGNDLVEITEIPPRATYIRACGFSRSGGDYYVELL